MDIIKRNQAATAGRKGQAQNRAPAPIQITAEQLLLESRLRQKELQPESKPRVIIKDAVELAEYRTKKRAEFERGLRAQMSRKKIWLAYARWEEEQKDFVRARSVFERALDVDYRETRMWTAYADMEIRGKFVNRARNVLDRATALLPRVDALWYKYVFLEEAVGNFENCRAVFERWMQWEPEEKAWLSFANFETRHGTADRARSVYTRYVACHPSSESVLRFAKWEERQGQVPLARAVFGRGLEDLEEHELGAEFFLAFARLEARAGEVERARAVYQFAEERLAALGAAGAAPLRRVQRERSQFERQQGDAAGVEGAVVSKRRQEYGSMVGKNPLDVDAWMDLLRLEEAHGDAQSVRRTYLRAVKHAMPPRREKRFWRRYVWIWLRWASWEETDEKGGGRTAARKVLGSALRAIPHSVFTFGKLWRAAAMLEVRDKKLEAARRVFQTALGRCPKDSVFRAAIDLEWQLGEVDRCRALHRDRLLFAPFASRAWQEAADLEAKCGEDERARAVLELALAQPSLDMPEAAWRAAIDLEVQLGELGRARALYRRLLDRSAHVKVWLAAARFEAKVAQRASDARAVLRRAYDFFKGQGERGHASRAVIADQWARFEAAQARRAGLEDTPALREALARRPQVTVRTRAVLGEDGLPRGTEEVQEFHFADDVQAAPGARLLDKARAWKAKLEKAKRAKLAAAGASGEGTASQPVAAQIAQEQAVPPTSSSSSSSAASSGMASAQPDGAAMEDGDDGDDEPAVGSESQRQEQPQVGSKRPRGDTGD